MPVLRRPDGEIYYEEHGSGLSRPALRAGRHALGIEMWHEPAGGPPRAWSDWIELLAKITASSRWISATPDAPKGDQGESRLGHLCGRPARADRPSRYRAHSTRWVAASASSFCLKLFEIAPARTAPAVLQNPIGLNPEFPTYFPDGFAEWTQE